MSDAAFDGRIFVVSFWTFVFVMWTYFLFTVKVLLYNTKLYFLLFHYVSHTLLIDDYLSTSDGLLSLQSLSSL